MSEKKSSVLKTILKLGFSFFLAAGLIYWIIPVKPEADASVAHRINLHFSWLKDLLSGVSIFWFVLSFLLQGITCFICFFRWKLLLKASKISIPYLTASKLGLIGLFFNSFPGGMVSGDFSKMVYVVKHSRQNRTQGVMSIIVDRILGLMGLFFIAMLACLMIFNQLISSSPEMKTSVLMMIGLGVCSIIGLIVITNKSFFDRLPPVHLTLKLAEKFLPSKIYTMGMKLYTAFNDYQDNKKIVIHAFLLSLAVHFIASLAVFSAAIGLGETQIPLKMYVASTQLGNLMGSVPIFPGGIGGRDVVISQFLLKSGTDISQTIAAGVPILYTFVISLWSVIGGIVFTTQKGNINISSDEEEAEKLLNEEKAS
ncbi:MAG: flippase-like domain-containing protein [Lentisphaeria bacterium]|nr:flippase-like domain-containing protein [Lentisphaeria bacterium]